jgi:23S rRNA pseudouridine2605 synthase
MAHGKSPTHTRKARKKKAAAKAPSSSKRTDAASSSDNRSSHSSKLAKPKTRASTSARASSLEASSAAPVRLQKLLAAAGFGSRRETERFLIDDRVTVNGRVAELGDSADPRVDEIRVDGERLTRERPAYWLLHKPRGVVTTLRDEAGRRTVIDFIPAAAGRVYPVGRLDKETSGLLLLTNDGDTTHALLHPSMGNEREYKVNVKGLIDAKAVTRLEKGIVLEEGRTAPGKVSGVRRDSEAGTSSFSLTLVEGRKRQIRRSLLMLGFPVRRLVRVRMGPLRLGRLAVGEARPLRSEERRALMEHVKILRDQEGRAHPRRGTEKKPQRTARSRKGTNR